MEEILNINQEKKPLPRYIEVDVLNDVGETVKGKITQRNEDMIQLYIFDQEHQGNQTRSYCTAYGLNPKIKKEYDTARSCSSHAFGKRDIMARMRYLIRRSSLDVHEVYSNLAFLMNQKANKVVSLGASKVLLAQYNLVNGLEKAKASKSRSRGKEVTEIVVKEIPGRTEDI